MTYVIMDNFDLQWLNTEVPAHPGCWLRGGNDSENKELNRSPEIIRMRANFEGKLKVCGSRAS